MRRHPRFPDRHRRRFEMTRRRHGGDHASHERWLVSYADFITLLFAFFVVMFATSQTDKGKAQQVSESVKKALAGDHMPALLASVVGGAPDDQGKGKAIRPGPGGAPQSPEGKKGQQRRERV